MRQLPCLEDGRRTNAEQARGLSGRICLYSGKPVRFSAVFQIKLGWFFQDISFFGQENADNDDMLVNMGLAQYLRHANI
jgi:hypothetical protein